MREADMDGGEAAHAQAHDMGALDAEMVEDGDGVCHRVVLAVSVRVLRHVGRRIAAGVIGDAAVAPREMAELRLPAHVVAREFVDEEHRMARPGLFVIEPGSVRRRRIGHGCYSSRAHHR